MSLPAWAQCAIQPCQSAGYSQHDARQGTSRSPGRRLTAAAWVARGSTDLSTSVFGAGRHESRRGQEVPGAPFQPPDPQNAQQHRESGLAPGVLRPAGEKRRGSGRARSPVPVLASPAFAPGGCNEGVRRTALPVRELPLKRTEPHGRSSRRKQTGENAAQRQDPRDLGPRDFQVEPMHGICRPPRRRRTRPAAVSPRHVTRGPGADSRAQATAACA